jgi:hypothetical protein
MRDERQNFSRNSRIVGVADEDGRRLSFGADVDYAQFCRSHGIVDDERGE